MLDLLIGLEYRRRALIRRVFDHCRAPDRALFGIAAMFLFVALLPLAAAPQSAPVVGVAAVVVIGSFALLGLARAATIVLLPAALVFFQSSPRQHQLQLALCNASWRPRKD